MKDSWKKILFALAVAAALHGQAIDTLRLLFIGNSLTYYYNLPWLVDSLAMSAGKKAVVDMSAFGGYTLEAHRSNSQTLAKINGAPWDYIILQEHSQIPVIPYWRDSSMYPACRSFNDLILNHGSITTLFMTWGWKNGGQMAFGGHYSIIFRDYFEMQDSVAAAYANIAEQINATLVPVGSAWARARTLDSLVDLWESDNNHPTFKGSYLTACVFYTMLFQANPIGLPYIRDLSPEDALFLQTVAYETVFGVDEAGPPVPAGPKLIASPNPFRNDIRFTIPDARCMDNERSLMIYDISGRIVKNIVLPTTYHLLPTAVWDGTDQTGHAVPPGVYFIRLNSGDATTTSKIIKLE